MEELTIPLPPLTPALEHLLAYLAILLVALTALAQGLRWAVPRLRVIAERTEWTADDRAVEWLAQALGVLTTGLDWVQRLLPQIRRGTPVPTEPSPPSSSPPSAGGAGRSTHYDPRSHKHPPGMLRAAVVVVVALLLCGCGATAQRTTATAACSTLLIAIGEASGIEAERAEADRQTVREVCVRYTGGGVER